MKQGDPNPGPRGSNCDCVAPTDPVLHPSCFCLPICPSASLCVPPCMSFWSHLSFSIFCLSALAFLPPLSPLCLPCPAVRGHRPALPTTAEGGQHLHGSPQHPASSPAYRHRGEPAWGRAGRYLGQPHFPFLAPAFLRVWGLSSFLCHSVSPDSGMGTAEMPGSPLP